MKKFLAITAVALFAASCNSNSNKDDTTAVSTIPPPANIGYNIVASYPHDTSSYTQGLIWQNNTLYEGTGIEGESHLMKVDLKTGKPTQSIPLDADVFGEGITILNDKIY